ncbi:MAG: calcium/proton exchanger [Pseudanabaenaceae cyanobacterium SKYGB_i_bin29]|nr:calcium/proton exchanger [Pseudanabaenaceae cyanobacterium SKYG29]MDW8422526.1 calcium/proton exchanger [Pseudanabaenaceae cyanobacterium SKYGB_i_bin29]
MTMKNWLSYLLLLFIPLSIGAFFFHGGAALVFCTSCLAIIPLASWLSTATEEIAVVLGPSWGGLLNATFGNATELIISIVALKSGFVNIVKASLTGSIIGNLLLVMGLSMLLGGLRYKEQNFQPTMARVNASVMNLAVVAILLPTGFNFFTAGVTESKLQGLSVAVSIVLILVYLSTLLFSMKTHAYLYDVGMVELEETEHDPSKVNLWLWIGVLLAATVLIAIESELLVDTLEEATESLGLTALFTGVILLPVVGNAAEHATAVTVAMKNKMELSMSVAVGSSMQIALFVAPLLVLLGWVLGQPMDLNFNPFELLAVGIAVLIANSITADGSSNWLEGALLLATYLVLGITFYFHPA